MTTALTVIGVGSGIVIGIFCAVYVTLNEGRRK